EYLAGAYLATRIDEPDELTLRQLSEDAVDPKWREVVPFVAGSLKNPIVLLGGLIRANDPFNLRLFIIGNCLAEIALESHLEQDTERIARRLVDSLQCPSTVDRERAVEVLGRM